MESRVGATGQYPKAGQVVDPRADLWERGQYSKPKCSTFLVKELTK
jgi:hypothetical protein